MVVVTVDIDERKKKKVIWISNHFFFFVFDKTTKYKHK